MLKTNICGVELKNPVMAASGTFGFGEEYGGLYDVSKLGAICTKGLTLNKREGNCGTRLHETHGGIMNSVGLQNPGIDEFIKTELPRMKEIGTAVIANLSGSTIEEYVEGAERLSNTDIHIIELNISCPNVKQGGMAFGIKSRVAHEVVSEVRKAAKKPLIVKLSPNAENIVEMAYECRRAGADGISLINTIKALAIDIKSRRPVFENIYAGLSGPCIKPIALRMVHEVSRAVDVPVIGMGGISSTEDAVEFVMAGADAVQIGTGNFMNPNLGLEIIEGLQRFMEEEGIKSLEEIKGIIGR